MEALVDEATLAEPQNIEAIPTTIETVNQEDKSTYVWDINQLKKHFDSEIAPNAEDMPDAVDIGPALLSIIHSEVTLAYDIFTKRGSYDLYENTCFVNSKNQLTNTQAVRILSYMRINQPFIDDAPGKVNPPRFEFLMPIFNYNEIKQYRRGRGMFLASDEVILLALRTSETMVLTGKEIEPYHSRFMKFPQCKMPSRQDNQPHIAQPKTPSQKEMEEFLEKCAYAGVKVYAKRTFPNNINDRASTTFRKLDWPDML